jgi:uncharacterized membrane protein
LRTSESVVVAAPIADVFPYVSRLEAYPAWLRLVHQADLLTESPRPVWAVELRAKVGPFARSKQLRMERVEFVVDEVVKFERVETDGRNHARWALKVELKADGEHSTDVTMHLAYDGGLWSGGLLERVLDDEIRRGRDGLATLVTDESRH